MQQPERFRHVAKQQRAGEIPLSRIAILCYAAAFAILWFLMQMLDGGLTR